MKQINLPGFETVWYLCYYFKYRSHNDFVVYQLMDFKANKKSQIDSFAEIAANGFKTLDIEIDYVIRVLGSREFTAVQPNKVRSLAIEINEVLGSKYRPLSIKKNRKTKEMKSLSKEARKKELDGVYELNDCPDLTDKSVLIVDDIFTFGTSMEAIGEVLKIAYPSVRLFGFVLALTRQMGEEGITGNEKEFADNYRSVLSKHEKENKK